MQKQEPKAKNRGEIFTNFAMFFAVTAALLIIINVGSQLILQSTGTENEQLVNGVQWGSSIAIVIASLILGFLFAKIRKVSLAQIAGISAVAYSVYSVTRFSYTVYQLSQEQPVEVNMIEILFTVLFNTAIYVVFATLGAKIAQLKNKKQSNGKHRNS